MLEVEVVGARIERTEDEIVAIGLVGGMGQIDVPEAARTRGAIEQGVENLRGASGSDPPIGAAMLADVLGQRDRRVAEDGRFACCGRGTRDVGVDAEIGAVVDARDQPEGHLLGQPSECLAGEGSAATECHSDAVRRGAAQTEASRPQGLESDRSLRRDRVADTALGSTRRYDQAVGACGYDAVEGCDSLRVHTIIVGED